MLEITIHRGARVIGGTCIEIKCNHSRILIDVGTPLMDITGKEIEESLLASPSIENCILPDIKGLYKFQKPDIDAVLISHAHLDHYGLLDHINPSIPVFLSRGSKELIHIGKIFYPPLNKVFYENFRVFEHWQPFTLGPFKITPYLMDHSAFDASAFLIEAEYKKIFYSGDFRGHGRKAVLLNRMLKNPVQGINCLFMEGTTLQGNHSPGLENEYGVENALYDIFSAQNDISFIAASGSNIDRLVSIFKATKRAEKTFVMDLYTFYVLDKLKAITPGLPPFRNDHIRIYYIYKHAQDIVDHIGRELLYKYRSRKIELDEIAAHRHQMVLKLPFSAINKISRKLSDEKPLKNAGFIYSMWPGYLEKQGYYYDFCNEHDIKLSHVHVSGHAYLDALKKLAGALNPEMLVPIHTLAGDDFDRYFRNVVRLDDAIPFVIGG